MTALIDALISLVQDAINAPAETRQKIIDQLQMMRATLTGEGRSAHDEQAQLLADARQRITELEQHNEELRRLAALPAPVPGQT